MGNTRKLETGIADLDRSLGGGFEPGSLTALVTSPSVQSHAVLKQVLRQRPTVYITTLRSESVVREDLRSDLGPDADVTVRAVGEACSGGQMLHVLSGSSIHAAETNEDSAVFDDVDDIVKNLDERQNVIIDPMNPLERMEDRGDYSNLLSRLATHLMDAESLGLVHCTRLGDPPSFRETTLTAADVVWELDTVPGKNNSLKVQTQIPKNRGGEVILEKVDLNVSDTVVTADNTRSI